MGSKGKAIVIRDFHISVLSKNQIFFQLLIRSLRYIIVNNL